MDTLSTIPLWVYLLAGYTVLQILTVGFHEKMLREVFQDDVTRWTLAFFGAGWGALAFSVVVVLAGVIWQVLKFVGRNMYKFYKRTGDLGEKFSSVLDKTLAKLFS